MKKKFAAVGFGLVLVLTTCSVPSTGAVQLNSISETTMFKPSNNVFDNPKVELPILKEKQLREQRIQKNTQKMNKTLKYLKTRNNKTPYVFSGVSPKYGWDCSGLVLWTYEQLGVKLKHSAREQSKVGKRISYKNAKPGDIVIFSNWKVGPNYHSAIYLGDGYIIDANSHYGKTVIEPLSNFKNDKIVFRRLIETE